MGIDINVKNMFDKTIAKLQEKSSANGAVIAVLNDKVVYRKDFGVKSFETNVPFDLREGIPFFYNQRSLLALTIELMAERKMVRMSDPLSKFFPELKNGDKVKVRHLVKSTDNIEDFVFCRLLPKVKETPGYENFSEAERYKSDSDITTRKYSFKEMMSVLGEDKLEAEPGSNLYFSFTSTVIMSELINRITGKEFTDYIDFLIFNPLGIFPNRRYNSDIDSYTSNGFENRIKTSVSENHADIVVISIDDMVKFAVALKNGNIVKSSTLTRMKLGKFGSGSGLYSMGDTLYFSLSLGYFDTSIAIHQASNYLEIQLYSYWGDHIFENGNYFWMSGPLHKKLASLYLRPTNPKLVRFNRKTRDRVFDIQLAKGQHNFISDIYHCVTYAYGLPEDKLYFLVDLNETIGFVGLVIDKKNKIYHISAVMIDETHQGKGYGKILINLACDILRENGAKRIEIGVVSKNVVAYKTYRSAGFTDKEVSAHFTLLERNL